ncbi:MAG TPA: twin-arginine translocase TatA/TatE family subunit [Candidatus Acidoferrales bacterium]|jgi:TatA/E family protein of Tat protein translocase|nr:twin-arginine translocase TatA/TatE family subunit [Candidatus Acidoferrales bacterium]
MGEFSVFHWLVVLAIILIFFGGRRIPEVMKGLGEGIRSFKDGIAGGTATATAPAPAQPTVLVAPGGVTAKAGHGQVSINWNPSTGASNYNVKRSGTSGGPYALIASTAAVSYSDEGLANGTYYYVVAAVGSYGESAHSIEVSATTA